MKIIPQKFKIDYHFPVYFVDTLFESGENYLQKIFNECGITEESKFLFVIDGNLIKKNNTLIPGIELFFQLHAYKLAGAPLIIPGGEAAKIDFAVTHKILEAINNYGIDRHSYVVGIGGGAVLDVAGFAAAIAHRGIRHIRIPTTVLSQNDSGVGVKNSINYFGKKNFIGTFAPPFLVINNNAFLNNLSDRDYRCGIPEAIKVGLIKDAAFFDFIETFTEKLNQRDDETIRKLIFRCAELHLQHIAGNDPFEKGNSRPLDYGHWSAHKLEQLSNYKILHGEAVAMGICLDAVYANLIGMLSKDELMRIINLIKILRFNIYAAEMEKTDDNGKNLMIEGLQEFREHLGGRLTIMLIKKIGVGVEVNEMDESLVKSSITFLKKIQ
ncbi:MAG: 3-dehydroquinate synthase [Bacteroidia bacterium]